MKLTMKHDGRTYVARTSEQMTMLLWKSAWLQDATPHEYMDAVARRVAVWKGVTVRTDSPRHFLEDIERSGLVTIDWGHHGTQT